MSLMGLNPPFLFIRLKSDNWGTDFKGSSCEIQRSCLGSGAAIPQLASSQKSQAENMQVFLSSEHRAPSQRGARSAEDFFFFLLCQAQFLIFLLP